LYNNNVVPFTFIMFGYYSMIEIIDNPRFNFNKINRIYFSGSLFVHEDKEYNNYRRDRIKIYNEIKHKIYNPGFTTHDVYMQEIMNSSLAVDLNGVGDPNKRSFEILSQGSLRISEYNELKWSFDEEFSEETVFKNSVDFLKKTKALEEKSLYLKCLKKQMDIYKKYLNKKWIREYISKYF